MESNPSKPLTVRLVIKGRVQGVGYRAWCMHTARNLGLSGWVRNLENGDVEALAYGSSTTVEAFITACRTGPSYARVTAVDVEKQDTPEKIPEGFQVC